MRGTLFAAVLGLLAAPALGAPGGQEAGWAARAFGVGMLGVDGEAQLIRPAQGGLPEERAIQQMGDGSAFGLELAYRWNRRFSTDLAFFLGDYETDFRLISGDLIFTDSGDIGTEVYTLGANWHLTPERRADVSVGVFAAMSFFDDIIFLSEVGLREKRSYDDDLGFGVGVALDWPFQPEGRWTLHVKLRYLTTILEGEIAGLDMDLDPFLPVVGIGYRF